MLAAYLIISINTCVSVYASPVGKAVICKPLTYDPGHHALDQALIDNSPVQRGFVFSPDVVDSYTFTNKKGQLSIIKSEVWSDLNYYVDLDKIEWRNSYNEISYTWILNRKTLRLIRIANWEKDTRLISDCKAMDESEFLSEMEKLLLKYKNKMAKLTKDNKI